jgi:hypothetical protein
MFALHPLLLNFPKVLNSILSGNGLILRLYSSIAERPKQVCDYYGFKGHGFFVIAKKI